MLFIGFPALEGAVIKPYVKLVDDPERKEDPPFNSQDEGVVKAKEFLDIIEYRMVSGSKFAFGDGPTWADFYLYPILADLRSIPAWQIASQRIVAWMKTMDELEAVQKTRAGTLAWGGRP
jgi:glutathione S-transferase